MSTIAIFVFGFVSGLAMVPASLAGLIWWDYRQSQSLDH